MQNSVALQWQCRTRNPRAHTVEDDVTKAASTSSDIAFLIGQCSASDSKLAAALEEYKASVARFEATKESLEDQAQKAAAAETEAQREQQTVSQVESEAVKDAANVEQAVKAQEDAEADELEVSSKAASAREAASDAEREREILMMLGPVRRHNKQSMGTPAHQNESIQCGLENPPCLPPLPSSSCGPRRERETHEHSQSKES